MKSRRFVFATLVACFVSQHPGLVFSADSPVEWRKAMVTDQTPAVRAQLEQLGARQLPVRHGLHLWEVPHHRQLEADEVPGVTIRTDLDLLRLHSRTFDSPFAPAPLPVRQLQLIQFRVSPGSAERHAIESAGARILGYIPENGFLIWSADPSATHRLTGRELVQYLGDFLPADAMGDGTFEAGQDYIVTVRFYDENNQIHDDLHALYMHGGIQEASAPFQKAIGVAEVSIKASSETIREIAALPTVLAIESDARPRLFGENGAMTAAGQTFLYDHDNNPGTPPVERAIYASEAPGPHENIYLRFLRNHLLYQPGQAEYQEPESYPIISVMDDGISNGGRTDRIEQPARFPVVPGGANPPDTPDYEDFHERGDLNEPSRVAFNFWYRWSISNGFGTDGWQIGNEASYPDLGREFITGPIQTTDPFGNQIMEGDEIGLFGHGQGVSSILAGYNGDIGPKNRHETPHIKAGDDYTYFSFGMGVSPFGRLGNAKFWSKTSQFWLNNTTGAYEPFDFYWITDKIWDTIQTIDGPNHGPVIVNCSFGNERFAGCSDPNYNPLDVNINPTSPNYDPQNPGQNPTGGIYDRFAQTFDLMTRSATHPIWHPNKQADRPTLFIFGAGQVGYEHYGNGWRNYLDGGSPQRSVWENFCGGPADDYIFGFQIPRHNTVSSPALSKNVMTVGVSEAFDMRPVEPCDPAQASIQQKSAHFGLADNPDDVIAYSPKGLHLAAGEARVKPDIVAPAVGDYSNYAIITFPGVLLPCYPDNFNAMAWPFQEDVSGTRVYQRAGGTSAAAPMIAAAAQLSSFHLKRVFDLPAPRPAMMKAYLITTTTFLRGDHSGKLDPSFPAPPPGYEPPNPPETPVYLTHPLPSPYQGWGRVNTSVALDQTPRLFVNEDVVLSEGEEWTAAGLIADSSRRFRVSLAWTDPPNLLTQRSTYYDLENNLDLEVRVTHPDGTERLYMGNRFSQDTLEFSTELDPSGNNAPQPDRVNNVECVFLPPQPAGSRMALRVVADGLNMDGLDPYNQLSSLRRQDFGLVVYNYVSETENATAENALDIAAGATADASWNSSLELELTDRGGETWFRVTDADAATTFTATLTSTAPAFEPGLAIEWNNENAVTTSEDPELGQDVYIVSGETFSGARTGDTGEDGWNIPAWNLGGKSILSFRAHANVSEAAVGVYLEATDGTRYWINYPADGNFPSGWTRVTRDLAKDLADAQPGAEFAHVIGISVTPGEGELRLADLRLTHSVELEILSGPDANNLESLATAPLPVDGDVYTAGPINPRSGEELYIRIGGNASRGGYQLTTTAQQAQPTDDSWAITQNLQNGAGVAKASARK